jgi:hypothetical protein
VVHCDPMAHSVGSRLDFCEVMPLGAAGPTLGTARSSDERESRLHHLHACGDLL